MSVTFAVTTCSIVFLYGAGSIYLVFDMVRDNAKNFMGHELDEVAIGIAGCNGDTDCIDLELKKVLQVSGDSPCAFRVRDESGAVLIERGQSRLLNRIRAPIEEDTLWREYLFTDGVTVRAIRVDAPAGAMIEMMVNSKEAIGELWRYTQASALTFLLSVVLAGLAGSFTARRGLKGLQDVVALTREVDLSATGASIRLDGAPSEVRDVGEALNRMLDRISQGLRDIQTFTAGLAHELRSPLQNLIGETEVMLLSDRSPSDYRTLMRSNLEDLHDLSDSVDNLVAYCRKSTPNGHALSIEEFDIAREVDIRIERLRRSAELQGVRIDVDVEGDARLHADREGCLRVLRNLVGNAIEWSPAGETIRVRICGQADSVRIEVLDRGPGMPVDLGDRVYEPFVSGRKAAGRRASYGLGLTICRSVMEDHGGVLRHASLEGGGTRFIAEFPRRRPPDPGRPTRAQLNQTESRQRKTGGR